MMPGPVPVKDAQRRRRNKTSASDKSLSHIPAEIHKLPPIEPTEAIPSPSEDWHPVATQLWTAQMKSGQAQWMEPSDWAMLYFVCESISRDLQPQFVGMTEDGEVIRDIIPVKGASMSAYLKAFSQLMMSEGERRRVRVELERERRAEEMAKAKVVDIVQDRNALFA